MKLELVTEINQKVSNGLKVVWLTDEKINLVGTMRTVIPANEGVFLNSGYRVSAQDNEVVMILQTDDAVAKGIYFPQDILLPGESKMLNLKLYALGNQVVFNENFPIAKIISVSKTVIDVLTETKASSEISNDEQTSSIEKTATRILEEIYLPAKNKTELVELGKSLGLDLDINDKKDVLISQIEAQAAKILNK